MAKVVPMSQVQVLSWLLVGFVILGKSFSLSGTACPQLLSENLDPSFVCLTGTLCPSLTHSFFSSFLHSVNQQIFVD